MSSLTNRKKDDDGGNDAPAFMVYYCSVMILLLAFFIVLQAFAEERHDEMFYRGRGSFISALEAFGLGVLSPDYSRTRDRQRAPRYKQKEGADARPFEKIIDPDLNAAQKALMELAEEMDLDYVEGATGYRVEIATPIQYGTGKTELDEGERIFLGRLTNRLESAIQAHGFVVRISSTVPAGPGDPTVKKVGAVLELANTVRSELIAGMSPRVRKAAKKHIYSFVRSDKRGRAPNGESPTFNLVLTKPYTD